MIRNGLIVIAGTAAVAIAAPTAAQGQSGTQAPPAAQASPTAQGPAAAPAQTNSQAPTNASPTGAANASENSVLATDEGTAATAAQPADATAKADKSDKKAKPTVIRAGPNKGMVINKKTDADDKAKAETPESSEEPQKD